MVTQLILPIQPPDANTFENFYTSEPNTLLIHYLKLFSARKGEPYLYFWGNSGSGCTHLLQACCHAAQQQGFSVAYLPLAILQKTNGPEILEDLEMLDMVCIDDVDSISTSSYWQEALFHFYNRLQAQEKYLLVSAKCSPRQLDFSLMDLVSRLSSGVLFQLYELEDAERFIAFQERARSRGLEFSQEVGQFLFLRLPRHAKAVFSALEQLDKATLSLKRKLTIPLVKTLLDL